MNTWQRWNKLHRIKLVCLCGTSKRWRRRFEHKFCYHMVTMTLKASYSRLFFPGERSFTLETKMLFLNGAMNFSLNRHPRSIGRSVARWNLLRRIDRRWWLLSTFWERRSNRILPVSLVLSFRMCCFRRFSNMLDNSIPMLLVKCRITLRCFRLKIKLWLWSVGRRRGGPIRRIISCKGW